jgi:hypothetical protein
LTFDTKKRVGHCLPSVTFIPLGVFHLLLFKHLPVLLPEILSFLSIYNSSNQNTSVAADLQSDAKYYKDLDSYGISYMLYYSVNTAKIRKLIDVTK